MNNYNDLSHRKSSSRLFITDSNGEPMKNAKLLLKQTKHEFLFGCGAFDAIPCANPIEGMDVSPFEKKLEKWFRLYNYGTLPFYWGNFEREEGKPNSEGLMNAARLLAEKGMKVKGHPLCWHTVCAGWLLQYDNETIFRKQIERIHREVSGFKGTVDMWDVINEVVIMPIFDKYDNAVTRICREKGRIGLVKEVFGAAKEANPDSTLLINDFNTTSSYDILIDGCLNSGVPIDAIGIQSHQHQGYWGREKLEEVLSRFGQFGVPIHFTENTLVSGVLIPPEIEDLNDFRYEGDATTPEGEERQAREMTEMYRILFADKNVEAITNWDFGDGAWLNAPCGLIRKDGSEKPAYKAMDDLINREWHTECEIMTDENGYAEASGFKGDYELSSNDGKSASFKLTDGLSEQKLALM